MTTRCIFVVILVAVFSLVVHSFLESVPSLKPELEMSLLGEHYVKQWEWDIVTPVDDKIYFSKDLSKTWKEAGDYCRSFGMNLATIETPKEWDSLSKGLSDFRGGGVWTDARESRQPTMYTWNHTGGAVNPSVVKGWDDRYIHKKDYYLCIVFYSYPSAIFPTGMYPVPCGNRQKILCQFHVSQANALSHTRNLI